MTESNVDISIKSTAKPEMAKVELKRQVSTASSLFHDSSVDDDVPGTSKRGPGYLNCVAVGHGPFLTYHFWVTANFLKKYRFIMGRYYVLDFSHKYILHEALKLFKDDKRFCVTLGAGVVNVARTIQWISKYPKTVVLIGAHAADDAARQLTHMCREEKLSFRLEEKNKGNTNIMCVFHHFERWCELYYVHEGSSFTLSFIDRPLITKTLERSNILFTSDACLARMTKPIEKLAYYASARFKLFCLILSDPEIMAKTKDNLLKILKYTDVCFITPQCALKLVQLYQIPQMYLCCASWKRQARNIGSWVRSLSEKTCTTVISDGLSRAYIHTDLDKGMSAKFKSPFLKTEDIVDYFGVNAAFTGGFMAMMIQGHQIQPCVQCAFFCSNMIASQYGMVFPKDKGQTLKKWNDYLTGMLKDRGTGKLAPGNDMPFTIFHTSWTAEEMENF